MKSLDSRNKKKPHITTREWHTAAVHRVAGEVVDEEVPLEEVREVVVAAEEVRIAKMSLHTTCGPPTRLHNRVEEAN